MGLVRKAAPPVNGKWYTMEEIKSLPIQGNHLGDVAIVDMCDITARCKEAPIELRISALEYLSTNVCNLGEDPVTEQNVKDYVEAVEDSGYYEDN